MSGAPIPPDTNASRRLWVQVRPPPQEKAAAAAAEALGISAAIAADLLASGVGAIIKSAADRLIAADQYAMKTVLAYEPAFVIRANAKAASFLIQSITLNVGAKPVQIDESNAIREDDDYKASPVVVQLKLEESADNTAVAARVIRWKYDGFLDPSRTWFRTRRRKVTVEVRISDAEGGVLLAPAMKAEGDGSTIGSVLPNGGERLPWMKRPVKSLTGERALDHDQPFGPVNVEASITEVAEPSTFAKILGTTLSNQKAAIEAYVKDRVTQTLDEAEAAKSHLALLTEASTARDQYEVAYTSAAEAKKKLDAASDAGAKSAAKQILDIRLAALRQKEILARLAFDRAGLPFEEMPVIPT